MSSEDNILKPWYEHLFNFDYGQANDTLKMENPVSKPAVDPKWSAPDLYAEKWEEPARRVIIDKHTPDARMFVEDVRTHTLAEMTASARIALRSGQKISVRTQLLEFKFVPWFEEKRKLGLKDVALIGDYVLPKGSIVLGDERIAMICWYDNSNISRVTVCYDDKLKELIINETKLDNCQFDKPIFPDNYTEFHEALLDIAYIARDGDTNFWANYFIKAAHILESDDLEYKKQSGLFFLPKPYFKYYYAVMECYQGGGMGSWNDVPIVGTREYRLTNRELHYQKCRALLYAINNC